MVSALVSGSSGPGLSPGRDTFSLRIQPSLIRSRYYVRIAKSDVCDSHVVAGANERRLYSQARTHCVVFLGKTLYPHSASLHPGV